MDEDAIENAEDPGPCPHRTELTRKDLYVNMLVRGSMFESAALFAVVDTQACNTFGVPEKRGRYVAVREWDKATGTFTQDSTRRGFKPSDLVLEFDWDRRRDWERKRDLWLFKQRLAEHRKLLPQYEAAVEFFTSIGVSAEQIRGRWVTVENPVSGVETKLLSSWVWPTRVYDHPSGESDTMKLVLIELGVLPGS